MVEADLLLFRFESGGSLSQRLSCGLYWKRKSKFGVRSAILVVTWLSGTIMNTELDFAINGFAVNYIAMVVGTLPKPGTVSSQSGKGPMEG